MILADEPVPWHVDGQPDVNPGPNTRGFRRIAYEALPVECCHLILCGKPRTLNPGWVLWVVLPSEADGYDLSNEQVPSAYGWEWGAVLLASNYVTIGINERDPNRHGRIVWASAAAQLMAKARRADWHRWKKWSEQMGCRWE